MPNLIPVQYGVGRVTQPFERYGEVVKTFQVSFQRLTNDFGAASLEFSRRRIQCVNENVRHPYGNLAHKRFSTLSPNPGQFH